MMTGLMRIRFVLHECHSLKEKRSVVTKVIAQTQNRFKVSAAEVGDQDFPGRGQIGIAVVTTEQRHANSVLDTILNFIESLHLLEVVQVERDYYPL